MFELDESGIEKPEPGQLLFDVVKPDRSDMDIVFEMMLKWGLELTLPVEKSEAAGYPIWSRRLRRARLLHVPRPHH